MKNYVTYVCLTKYFHLISDQFNQKHALGFSLPIYFVYIWIIIDIPPDSLGVAGGLDHSEGLRSTPVPEVELVVGGDEEQLGGGVEG